MGEATTPGSTHLNSRVPDLSQACMARFSNDEAQFLFGMIRDRIPAIPVLRFKRTPCPDLTGVTGGGILQKQKVTGL